MKTIKWLAHLVPGILFGLLLAEGIIRLAALAGLFAIDDYDPQKILHQYSSDPELVYELKPSFTLNDGRHNIKTNSTGQRDREYPLEVPEGTFRIAVLGDSVTFGENISSADKLFTEIVEKRFEDENLPVEVINFSAVGYNSSQEHRLLDQKVLQFNPDLVLVAVCLNDHTLTDGLGPLSVAGAPWSPGPRLRSRLITLLHTYSDKIKFNNFSDKSQIWRLFDRLSQLNQQGIQTGVIVVPYLFQELDSYAELGWQQKIEHEAASRSLLTLDLLKPLSSISFSERKRLYASGDQVHLSEEGMKFVGNQIYLQISPLIKRSSLDSK